MPAVGRQLTRYAQFVSLFPRHLVRGAGSGVRDRVKVLAPAAVALTGLVFVVLYGVALTSVSGASRRATPREWDAIKAAAMRDCRKEQPVPAAYGTCRWRGRVLVSTVNRRYAWASVTGPSYDNSGILRRPTMHSRRWRVIRVVGGGVSPCSRWWRAAPREVVHDLRIRGYTEGSGDFSYRRC